MVEKQRKVTVIGAGQVGMACVVSILQKSLCEELALVDVDEEKVRGEVMDLEHGAVWLQNARITGSTDYSNTDNSSVVVITAGVRQREGESRLNLVQRNVAIFKNIIPEIMSRSPEAVLVVISNPCDVMTWVAWKLSGLPSSRVIGTGTTLDTSRFRQFLSKRIGVGASAIHGYVIGEHGDSSVPVWSCVTVGGVPLKNVTAKLDVEDIDDKEEQTIRDQIADAAMQVIKLKGYTNWGIGMTTSAVVGAILQNTRAVHPVSTLVTGHHDVETDTFVSVPCVLGSGGVIGVLPMNLTQKEHDLFVASVGCVHQVVKDVSLD